MTKTGRSRSISKYDMKRRDFLVFSQQLLLSASAIFTVPFSLSAGDIDELKLKMLDAASALILASISRLLFPYDALSDSVYLDVVRDIDSDMQSNEHTRVLLGNVAVLVNEAAGADWMTSSTAEQIKTLESLQNTEFFSYLLQRSINSLYRNRQVWELIGYQGSSIEYGGYLHRGFDDIDWLDDA